MTHVLADASTHTMQVHHLFAASVSGDLSSGGVFVAEVAAENDGSGPADPRREDPNIPAVQGGS